MDSLEVVTPSFNRAEPLRRMLGALARQTRQAFSVTVVDDCSTVPVEEVLRGLKYPFDLRILRTPRNSGPAAARNLAVNSTEKDIVAFVDDDVVPDAALLDTHLRILSTHGTCAVSIGPLLAPADWKPTPWNRWEADTLATEYGRMSRGEYRATWRQFFTGNAMLRREQFLEVGGFDQSFARAEDIEFAYRLAQRGAEFFFDPRAIGWHYAERSLANWRKIPVQYAEFDVSIDELHPELGWNRIVSAEESRRHRATRLLNRVAAPVRAERKVASLAILGARTAHATSLHSASSKLLSVAYNLEYARRRRELLRGRCFNSPSTVLR